MLCQPFSLYLSSLLRPLYALLVEAVNVRIRLKLVKVSKSSGVV